MVREKPRPGASACRVGAHAACGIERDRTRQTGRALEGRLCAQSTAQVPDDLRAALAKNKKAKGFFETLDSTNRYAILHRIHNARKAETRTARIEKFLTMLIEGKTIYPLKPRR